MKKHCLLVIALLALFSFNTQAQEENHSKKKNTIYIEGGIPFGFKETKNYWDNPNNYFAYTPKPKGYDNYTYNIKYTRDLPFNLQISVGYKYITLNNSTSSKHYSGDWKAKTYYLGVGYNLNIIKNLSFQPSINIGYSNLSYLDLNGLIYAPSDSINLLGTNERFLHKEINTNPLYLNAELAFDYTIINRLHLRLIIGYDKYFVKDLVDTEGIVITDKKEFTFQTLEAKLGLGFSF